VSDVISSVRADEIILERGFPKLPLRCSFYSTSDGREVVIVAPYPEDELPTVFYIREGHARKIASFKSITPSQLTEGGDNEAVDK